MTTIALPRVAARFRTDNAQLLYAAILEIGVFAGLVILFVTFALYVSGIVAPAVPVHVLPEYWGLSAHEYLATVNAEYLHHEHAITGWAWLSFLSRSDYLNYLGIVFLSGVTIVCFVGIIPVLLRQRDRAYATMAVIEVIVLTLAASGILAVGH
jgi:hypothetical protein